MLKISWVKIGNLQDGCITDTRPNISFALLSDVAGESLKSAVLSCGDWRCDTQDQINNTYGGAWQPFTTYTVMVEATGTSGETATAQASFSTGRLDTPWQAKWITDLSVAVPEKSSPVPITFHKAFAVSKQIKRAWVNATALGIYELALNGQKVGKDYFAPGFTTYEHQLQYQTYDVTALLQAENTFNAVVAGGWAVGSFTYHRKNKISADSQTLLCEIHVEYTDGTQDVIATDTTWQVTQGGNYLFADWYDGETYDATIDMSKAAWKVADITAPRKHPRLLAQYGVPVCAHETLQPVAVTTAPSGEVVYDFGQNFAGVISALIQGKRGQTVVFRHAEVLVNGELFVKSLRTAKAKATYICTGGEQSYSPHLTYMGFRYVGVTGIAPEDLRLYALVLHSDLDEIGAFECSNPDINQLEQNIRWGGKSNFVDIPTDCPQRDERQGWTGDIAVFASTACYHFDMSRFFDKWLLDVKAEQGRGGGIPMVVPRAGDAWPALATSCWGDSCVLVPWAEYLARGDESLLNCQYPVMKKFLKAAKWWSGFLSVGKNNRRIWQRPFHFGDWCAPGEDTKQWLKKGKWVATAYFANSCAIVAQIAQLLGKPGDAKYYTRLRNEIITAYRKVFTDGNGKLKQEFQTAYVLPLHFGMTNEAETKAMAANLARLVKAADNHLTTGFTGTPYLLFALADNGYADVAYDVLLQDTCPSWLYEVKAGGTTIWERWDALRPDGTVNISDLQGNKSDEESNGGMVSFNHYANGAVGDWLYRRILGIEPTSGGYKTFNIKPVPGGGITYAKGSTKTPYGLVAVRWEIAQNEFEITVTVPVSATCALTLPNGETRMLVSGTHRASCKLV